VVAFISSYNYFPLVVWFYLVKKTTKYNVTTIINSTIVVKAHLPFVSGSGSKVVYFTSAQLSSCLFTPFLFTLHNLFELHSYDFEGDLEMMLGSNLIYFVLSLHND